MAPAALVAVTGLFSLLPGWTAALHSPIVDSPPLGAARIPAGTLSSGTLPGTLTPVAASITELETRAFLEAHDGDPARAQEALYLKTSWRHAQGRVTIAHVAPFYRSEGYTVALEGLVDSEGNPLVFANGMPHGSPEEVSSQVMYANERVIAQCEALGTPSLRATTIVNVRANSFRFPDRACRAALSMQDRYFPWSAHGRTVFVGVPQPVRSVFAKLRPFVSRRYYDSIQLVAQGEPIDGLVNERNLPVELGGLAEWSIEAYIAERCREEGICPDAAQGERRYKGRALINLAL